jgi:uncharacterized protein YggE
MTRFHRRSVLWFSLLWLLPIATATAQFSGSRGGVPHDGSLNPAAGGFPPLQPDVAQSYITVEGQAELRVKPTEIRVVLAVTAEEKTPAACAKSVSDKIKALKEAWIKSGIAEENIVEDFIAVLPRYEFEVKKMGGRDVAAEQKAGYLMQSNLHLAVKDDAQAKSAIGIAFDNDVADIIAFDYWSKELDVVKVKARVAALKAAREKSDVLLGAMFAERPPVINLQEKTQVYYPESLYQSFTNSSDAEFRTSYADHNLPQIRMFRPKNTYYRGLYLDGDVQPKELAMRSEISVVSTVRLYFESPAAKQFHRSKRAGQ